ncbi:hypothetical protein ABZU86_08430 [Streptomyces sp. NPDC005271]|uniref:hypothetical protein n=1 Tax=unclassified Streptomyces TaxID=2593676 RepID=UPI0033B35454
MDRAVGLTAAGHSWAVSTSPRGAVIAAAASLAASAGVKWAHGVVPPASWGHDLSGLGGAGLQQIRRREEYPRRSNGAIAAQVGKAASAAATSPNAAFAE